MAGRISRDDLFMGMAELISRRGTCKRAQVGAVVVKDGRTISMGYNGPPSGMPHCGPEYCDIHSPCIRSVHAEANAIYYAARAGISVEGATIYCTHSPCRKCSEAIINSGIVTVIYGVLYGTSPAILQEAGIEVIGWGA